MIYKEIFYIIFRLLNFGILIWLFTHVFFKYFYHDFKVKLKKQLDWWLALRDHIMQLRIKQKELDSSIAHEQWESEQLLDNLARWQSWVQKEQQLKKQQFDERIHHMKARYLVQEKNYQETLLARQWVPRLFVQAHTQLSQTYQAHEEKAAAFVDKTINQLKVRHD